MSRIQGQVSGALLALLRIMLAAWIGAAVLFVITSVAEQTSPEFDSLVRDQLATIRFPKYYVFGYAVHGMAAVICVALLLTGPGNFRHRVTLVFSLLLLSCLLMCADYFWVYRPLQELIVPPGQTRTQEFVRLHNLSRHANEVHLTVALLAAFVAAWPLVSQQRPADRAGDSSSVP